eukprot:3463022-Prymnesium_polylepis.3
MLHALETLRRASEVAHRQTPTLLCVCVAGWSAYLESAAIVDEGGTATGALQDARAARAAFEAREAAADRAAEAA